MKLLEIAKNWMPRLASSGYSAASSSTLPDPTPIKPPGKQSSLPGFRTQISQSTSVIAQDDRRLANTDTLTLRNAASTKEVIRNFAIASPDLSATVGAYLRTGIPEQYTVIGRNMDGTVSPEGTQLANALLRRMTYVPDYSQGFNSQASVYALACSLGKEFMYYGAACFEVVLDKLRLPTNFAPVHSPSIKFYEDAVSVRPVQDVGGTEIDLDIPTFIYSSMDQDLKSAYASSPLEAAIQPVLADQQFMDDLRRLMKRAIYPRIVAQLVEEKCVKAAPADVRGDPQKMAAYMQSLLDTVSQTLNNLNPEDAIISFDGVDWDYMNDKQGDVSANLQAVQDLINSKLATGAKVLPAVLGHGQGGNHASTEAMLFVKSCNVLRLHLQDLFSRGLTVACRLMGQEIYVEFKYAPINLRPEDELEAYQAMFQSRTLELLSLGMITDEEACIQLTGNLPPNGYTPLSGTMFKVASANTGGNPDSNTSAMEQTLKPKTPAAPKGPVKKAA